MNKLLKHKKKNKQKLMLIKLLTRTIIIRRVVGGLSHKSSRNNKKNRRKKINTNKKEIGKLLRVVDELFLPAESSATSSLQRDVIRKGKKVKTMLAPSCLHTEMLFFAAPHVGVDGGVMSVVIVLSMVGSVLDGMNGGKLTCSSSASYTNE